VGFSDPDTLRLPGQAFHAPQRGSALCGYGGLSDFIAAIREKRAPLVDTNVARVLSRVFAPRLNPKRPRDLTRLWKLAGETLPRTGRPKPTKGEELYERCVAKGRLWSVQATSNDRDFPAHAETFKNSLLSFSPRM
jgi:hypothetical protein